ncbi:hypothetical protein M434DRAFT_214741 [Hypoxylon sp. CO27-5]|nr:hypothetical protein M434DRAFT_214741 [Hypoxylon sp. CO27-5]
MQVSTSSSPVRSSVEEVSSTVQSPEVHVVCFSEISSSGLKRKSSLGVPLSRETTLPSLGSDSTALVTASRILKSNQNNDSSFDPASISTSVSTSIFDFDSISVSVCSTVSLTAPNSWFSFSSESR